jgi:hypothetical protein
MAKVEKAIVIFEAKTKGFTQGLFVLNNMPSHHKHAPNALLVQKLPENPSSTWCPHPSIQICNGILPNGKVKLFYFPDDHPQYPA